MKSKTNSNISDMRSRRILLQHDAKCLERNDGSVLPMSENCASANAVRSKREVVHNITSEVRQVDCSCTAGLEIYTGSLNFADSYA